mmetsp:Transcript_38996/g.64229  ORF Transcript_38996/g.64229 Transcript_38996/m.64229 type:complete len:383 (-) Transcript_38996:7-1155(-)
MSRSDKVPLACGFWIVFHLAKIAANKASFDATCQLMSRPQEEGGKALLQVRADAGSRILVPGPSSAAATPEQGMARDILPEELRQLGVELLGSEMNLDELVFNSRLENIQYAGIHMLLRMVNGDYSNSTLLDEGSPDHLYGLDKLEEVRDRHPKQSGINMLDLGSNYGAVSIAAFKLYPDILRAVAVEPIPSTFFFLRWNMWLNGVPALEVQDVEKPHSGKTGILAINKGVVAKSDDLIDFCYTPPLTMNALICSCLDENLRSSAQQRQVQGITMRHLVDLFGSSPITVAKVDCEGCEFSSLPAVRDIIAEDPDRIRRLVGELHYPSRDVEDVACKFDQGRFFVRLCATQKSPVEGMDLSCGEQPVACAHPAENPHYDCFLG